MTTLPNQSPRPSTRRNGKVARLPKETRDKINRMLDDGFTYKAIIDALGDAGSGLNLQNLSNWRQGGYHEWVTSQELTERTKAYTEHAIEMFGVAPRPVITRSGMLIGGPYSSHLVRRTSHLVPPARPVYTLFKAASAAIV